jgi:hypothetical protein
VAFICNVPRTSRLRKVLWWFFAAVGGEVQYTLRPSHLTLTDCTVSSCEGCYQYVIKDINCRPSERMIFWCGGTNTLVCKPRSARLGYVDIDMVTTVRDIARSGGGG